jgi:uncharacterized protein (UPF0261 family)
MDHVKPVRRYGSEKKQLLIITTLDTKGREAAFIKECAVSLGGHPVVMDIGVLGAAQSRPDISNNDVVAVAGYDLQELIKAGDRPHALRTMQEGGALVAQRLFKEGKLDGIIGLGGGTGTSMISYIMRSLPFGIPKVIVSTVASRDVREYIQTKDIVMFHSVADLLGFNDFIRHILAQATHAVCGMMERRTIPKGDMPTVGITAYGPTSPCAIMAEDMLLEKGYEMMGFHANGMGGNAMEELISEGQIDGVLDVTPHEVADEMYKGYCSGIRPNRLETAGRMGIPLVFAPGGLELAVFSPHHPMPKKLIGRKRHNHDYRWFIRLHPEEMQSLAVMIGEKLNKSPETTHVLIPKKGWDEVSREGMPFWDPAIDQVFTNELKKILNPIISVEEMDVHINDPVFAGRAVAILDALMKKNRAPEQNLRVSSGGTITNY